jgi:hypothetical protein
MAGYLPSRGLWVRVSPNACYRADNVFVWHDDEWKQADYVWAYSDTIGWHIIWAYSPTAAQNPTASIAGGASIDVDWEANYPEAVETYRVRRSDGTLVDTVTADGGPYSITDTDPIPGSGEFYTIESFLPNAVPDTVSVDTGTINLDLPVSSFAVTFQDIDGVRNTRYAWSGVPAGVATVKLYRTDGSFVIQLPSTSTVWFDPSPRADVDDGTHRIDSITTGGAVAGSVDSNTVDQALPPSSASASLISDYVVRTTWSATGVGEHTGFDVYYGGSGYAGETAEGAEQLDFTIPNADRGTQVSFLVTTKINNRISDPVVAGTIALTPNVPVGVAAVATGSVGQLRLTWGAPSGSVASYEAQVDDGGWTSAGDNTSPVVYTWSPGSGSRSMRVRSVGYGGATSAWVTVSATPLWDATAPSNASISSFEPKASYGRMALNFTVTSDTYEFAVDVENVSTGSWVRTFGTQVFERIVGTFGSGTTVRARVRVRDEFGNARTGSWVSYTLQASPTTVNATATGHWRGGTYRYDSGNPGRVYQGYFSSPANEYTGMFWYGTAIAAACDQIGTFAGKLTVTAMSVRLYREGGGNNVQDCMYVGLHNIANEITGAASAPSVTSVSCIGTLAYNQNGTFALTSTQRNLLRDGTQRGLALKAPTGKPYLFGPSRAEQAAQGRITITHLG